MFVHHFPLFVFPMFFHVFSNLFPMFLRPLGSWMLRLTGSRLHLGKAVEEFCEHVQMQTVSPAALEHYVLGLLECPTQL